MKKKDMAQWLDDMATALDDLDEVVTNAPVTKEELDALRCGLMGGLMEAGALIAFELADETPKAQAYRLMGDAISVYVEEDGNG